MKTKTIVLTETANNNDMIGVITDIENTEVCKLYFEVRFKRAIEAHFDCEEFTIKNPFPNVFKTHYFSDDIILIIDGHEVEISIQESWIY